MSEEWSGETPAELVAKDICPRCLGPLDTGWECNNCGFDAMRLVTPDKADE